MSLFGSDLVGRWEGESKGSGFDSRRVGRFFRLSTAARAATVKSSCSCSDETHEYHESVSEVPGPHPEAFFVR